MKLFLFKIFSFFLLIAILLAASLFFIRDNIAKTSLLGAINDKHALMEKATSAKIVFVGGSNISFGLESKKVNAKFNMPVINTGITASIGLQYMINDVKPYINKGDVIVLTPEYEYFYSDEYYGGVELLYVVFDVNPEGKKMIPFNQWLHLSKFIPTYAATKIKNFISTSFQKNNVNKIIGVYDRESFNNYGDTYIHWNMPNQSYKPCPKTLFENKVNPEVILFIKEFKNYVIGKGAQLLVIPPVIDATSFDNQKNMIDSINLALKRNNVSFECDPKRYRFSETYFFNSHYHLNKKGVDVRTELMIEDLSAVIKTNDK